MESSSDIKLIDKALAGDKDAFGILADKYYAHCLAIAGSIIEDKKMLQKTWCKMV